MPSICLLDLRSRTMHTVVAACFLQRPPMVVLGCQVRDEQVNLNKDLALVESKMASEVDAATSRIDRKMGNVKKGAVLVL